LGAEAFAVTTTLIKKADGSKFGKTEEGNVWLSKERTSPYKFYQYWLNCSDEDAASFIRIFTLFDQDKINSLNSEHQQAPHLRILQKALAEDITKRVHGEMELQNAITASNILFGKATKEDLASLSVDDFLTVFEGVPQKQLPLSLLSLKPSIVDVLVGESGFLSSNSDARRELKAQSISINKEKVDEHFVLSAENLLNGKFVLIGKGKKTNFILFFE
jgi:tyrosyl-tRNA synthetase